MGSYVLGFEEIDRSMAALVGGKGANLGELARIDGVHVPEGFCVSTAAFRRVLDEARSIGPLLDRLALLTLGDREEIAVLSAALRSTIAGIAVPADIRAEIARFLARCGAQDAYAVRSSATAEDLPAASFAGQQDTFLNVLGEAAILAQISRCWASLFSERAVTYRLRNGFDHRQVHLAVVVQKMVFPQAAGILFTADPVSSHRKVSSIEASFGLGEALVAGLVNADRYKVRDGQVIDRTVSAKMLAIVPSPGGGVLRQAVEPERQNSQVLADEQILALARLGRRIEEAFGAPQDIEWCLDGETFYLVQSRPITTLYPIPQAGDQENRVYVSVGHQQMMTDPMKPLGWSFFLLTTRAPMRQAGGRLFVDVTAMLAAPGSREAVIESLGRSDPLIKDALMTVVGRGDFIKPPPQEQNVPGPAAGGGQHAAAAGQRTEVEDDPAVVSALIRRSERLLEEVERTIQAKSGLALFDFIREDLQQLQKIVFDPTSLGVIMAALDASRWLNEKMHEWLGEKNAADTLSQSAPGNVTAQMGLALLDVADVIRPYPAVIASLQQVQDDDFLDALLPLDGGPQTRAALAAFLDQYGMRCSGEIDITRPRWREEPATLLPMILGNIKNFAPGEGKRRFEQGRLEALNKQAALLGRLRLLPDGEQKAAETERMIDRLRRFIGYREYPKYAMVSRYFVYKQALLKEAGRLVQANVLHELDDCFYLTFDELAEVVRTQTLDGQVIGRRKEEHKRNAQLLPPRVITSDGETVAGAYKRENLPAGALAGLAVSAGVVEGRARLIRNLEEADLAEGDILVTSFTDPSWTPLFVAVKGLVTEVGGLMTHGAVIAREYGLPAVVGVEGATRLIREGQRIRVHGTDGYVELL